MRKTLLFFILITALFSCSIDEDDAANATLNIETLPIAEAKVPEEFVLGETHQIEVTYFLPHSCYSFYGLYYQQDGNARIVAIDALISGTENCNEKTIKQTYTFNVTVSQQEDYIFKFFKGTTTDSGLNEFEEVRVPVILK